MEKFRVFGTSTPEESQRERDHRALARQMAAEGIVLLKNDGFTFPTTLWMDRFQEKYDVDVAAWRRVVEEKIKGFSPLQTMKMFDVIHEHPMPYPACTPILPDEVRIDAVLFYGQGGMICSPGQSPPAAD